MTTTIERVATTLNQRFMRVAETPDGVVFDHRHGKRVELPVIVEGRSAMKEFINAKNQGRDLSIDELEEINDKIGLYKDVVHSRFGRYDDNADNLAREISEIITQKACDEICARNNSV